MRKCINKGSNMYLALLEQRNMPRQCQDSPRKMMCGRNLRTQILQKSTKFPEQAKKLNRQETVKNTYNKHAKDLPKLHPN